VIIVVGSPLARVVAVGQVESGGLGAEIAAAAAGAGATVQVVGRVGDDPAGDSALLDLARRRVGHVAVLRDPGRETGYLMLAADDAGMDAENEVPKLNDGRSALEPADLQLALSYLPEYRVIVVAEPLEADAMRVVVDAAAWSGAALVVVGGPAADAPLPDDATVFEPPDDGDPEGAFAAMVGAYAAGLDRGNDPRTAFEAASASVGSTAAAE
jgi:ribokinase